MSSKQEAGESHIKWFIRGSVSAVIMIAILFGLRHFFLEDSPVLPPYALKQNGDTLFIPTQVVVRHDTIVVIKTTDSVKLENSAYWISGINHEGVHINRMEYKKAGTEITYDYPGGYIYPRVPKAKDTIYEHKIIYY